MNVKKNFILNISYQVLTIILPLITGPYLSRILGASQLGEYSYTNSVAYYFVLFAMLGVTNYGNRSIAKIRNNISLVSETFWSIFYLQLSTTVIAVILYIFYSLSFSDNTTLALVWIPYVISAGLDINWFFFGMEEFKITVGRNFAIKSFTFIFMFIVVKGKYALFYYCALMSLSNLLSVISVWPFLFKTVSFYKPSISDIVSHIKPNLILFVPVLAVSLYTVLDKIMLGQLSSMQQNGFFNNSFNVVQMPFTLIGALGTVMLPRMSNLLANGGKMQAYRYLNLSISFVHVLSSALLFGLAAISSVFAPVFWGYDFSECGSIIKILVFEIPFMAYANVLRTQYLMPLGKDKTYVISVIAGAFVNIVINVLLIPSYGAIGAACSTVAAEAVVCMVQAFSVGKKLPQYKWLKENLPYYIIGVLMFFVVTEIGNLMGVSLFTLIVQIIIGIFTYCILLIMWLLISKNSFYSYLNMYTNKIFSHRLSEK